MTRFRPATDADEGAWQALLGRAEAGDFLHDWAWADVAAFDGQPQRRFVAEEEGKIVALAAAQVRPIGLGRSFWYVPHGPVLDYAAPQAANRLAAMRDGLHAAARVGGAVAVRLEPRVEVGSPAAAAFDAAGLRRVVERLQIGQTRIVELGEDASLHAGFDADKRAGIRRAHRDGVVVTIMPASDEPAMARLHALVVETQGRAGFPLPALERYLIAGRALGRAGRGRIYEARLQDELLSSGMAVLEGTQSFYLFAGSRRVASGTPQRYASYALQWAMMRDAREAGARRHDLWGVAPPGAGPDHPWAGVGLFKKGFGGREVIWAGSWEIVVDPLLHRLRAVTARLHRRASAGARPVQ